MLFTKTEYKERLIKVQTEMQKKGIDLLVSSDPANMNYLSGSSNIPKSISILHPHIHMIFWLK